MMHETDERFLFKGAVIYHVMFGDSLYSSDRDWRSKSRFKMNIVAEGS